MNNYRKNVNQITTQLFTSIYKYSSCVGYQTPELPEAHSILIKTFLSEGRIL